jgi:hypothetical protein
MAPTLLELTRKTYADQAKWYLNAFWAYGAQAEAENVWAFARKFIELDNEKKKNGNELDEFWSHKYVLHYSLFVVVLYSNPLQVLGVPGRDPHCG